jgi:hypothetical protein
MSLEYGKYPAVPVGMSASIYTEIDIQLSPPLKEAINKAESDDEKESAQLALETARETWKKISYAVAKGVIDHLITNMEIFGVETKGDIETSVSGKTETVIFTQSNDGTGLIR